MRQAIRQTIENLRAVMAYELLRLATRIYPQLPGEFVDMTSRALVKQSRPTIDPRTGELVADDTERKAA